MLTKVVLEGKMKKVIGRDYLMLDFGTVGQMFGLLCANFPHLKTWLRNNINQYKFMEVECKYDNGTSECIDDEGLGLNRACKEVRLLPIFTGAGGKNGVMQTILGAVVTVIGIIVCAFAGWTGVGAQIGGSMIAAGIGMMLGGIITMLMAPSDDDQKDGGASYYFNGAVNTTKQGMPVPLVFGRTMVGSAVISASIDVTTDDRPKGKQYFDDGGK